MKRKKFSVGAAYLSMAARHVANAKAEALTDIQLQGVTWMAMLPGWRRKNPDVNLDDALFDAEQGFCANWWRAWLDHPTATLELLTRLKDEFENPTPKTILTENLAKYPHEKIEVIIRESFPGISENQISSMKKKVSEIKLFGTPKSGTPIRGTEKLKRPTEAELRKHWEEVIRRREKSERRKEKQGTKKRPKASISKP